MPVVSSVMISATTQADGRVAYTERHTDHLGGRHYFSYRVTTSIDALAVMAARAISLIGTFKDDERSRIAAQIEAGVDPATITPEHLTNAQALRVVVKTAMHLTAAEAILTAEFIDTLTNTQLDAVFNVAIRQRIRTRVAGLLALKADLAADQALEEEL